MSEVQLDISGLLRWEDGLPHPQWDLVRSWVDSRDLDDPGAVWTTACRAWLVELTEALGEAYDFGESEHFQMLASGPAAESGTMLAFAERCRANLLSGLDNVVHFQAPGKEVIIALGTAEDYHRYIAPHYPDGEHSRSSGLHIRSGYPHMVLLGRELHGLESTLAHELTHAGLHHLSMPQWIEEGLAQVFGHAATGRSPLQLDRKTAEEHYQYWGANGLDEFWRGEGFHRTGEVCKLSYQLAEILIRVLIEDARPRWFGLVKKQQRRFRAFLRNASDVDCGQASCRFHMGYGIDELAGQFLGPGDWTPSL